MRKTESSLKRLKKTTTAAEGRSEVECRGQGELNALRTTPAPVTSSCNTLPQRDFTCNVQLAQDNTESTNDILTGCKCPPTRSPILPPPNPAQAMQARCLTQTRSRCSCTWTSRSTATRLPSLAWSRHSWPASKSFRPRWRPLQGCLCPQPLHLRRQHPQQRQCLQHRHRHQCMVGPLPLRLLWGQQGLCLACNHQRVRPQPPSHRLLLQGQLGAWPPCQRALHLPLQQGFQALWGLCQLWVGPGGVAVGQGQGPWAVLGMPMWRGKKSSCRLWVAGLL